MPDAPTGAFHAYVDYLPGYSSGADLSTKLHHFVKANASNQVVSCDTAGEEALGILHDTQSVVDRAVSVAYGDSISKCVASAAIAKGAYVTTTNTGRAVTAVTAGHHILGKALTAATANGEVFTVQLLQGGAVVPA